MSKLHLNCLVFLLLGACQLMAAPDWELKRDRDGIRVYTRSVEGSKHKAVRATVTLPTSLTAAVALVRDASSCSAWAAFCVLSYEYEVLSPTESYIYSYNDVPWPLADRDALARVTWSQDPETLAVTMVAEATEGIMPVTDAVRITDGSTTWQFVPRDDGKLDIITEAHIDPAGPTPAWITNLLLIDSPFDTLKNMRSLLATGRYNDRHFSFITEPEEP